MSLQPLLTVEGAENLLSNISVSVSLIVLIVLLFVHTVDHRLFRPQCCTWCNHDSIAAFCRLPSIVKPF